MIHFLLSFVTDVFIVLFFVLFFLLSYLWLRGKQYQQQQQQQQQQQKQNYQRSPFTHFPSHPAADPDAFRHDPSLMLADANMPTPRLSSPSVMPRRLSFASSSIAAGPSASTSANASRRVTFSLTPEQQQNEYDKRASANLARRRAPAVVSHHHIGTSPPVSSLPLVELFPHQHQHAADEYQIHRSGYAFVHSLPSTDRLRAPTPRYATSAYLQSLQPPSTATTARRRRPPPLNLNIDML